MTRAEKLEKALREVNKKLDEITYSESRGYEGPGLDGSPGSIAYDTALECQRVIHKALEKSS